MASPPVSHARSGLAASRAPGWCLHESGKSASRSILALCTHDHCASVRTQFELHSHPPRSLAAARQQVSPGSFLALIGISERECRVVHASTYLGHRRPGTRASVVSREPKHRSDPRVRGDVVVPHRGANSVSRINPDSRAPRRSRRQEFARVRTAGFSDTKIAEIIAHVALNVFTNYFNRAADTEIDSPRVAAAQLAQVGSGRSLHPAVL
jgi:hypothetical protein